MNVTDKAIKSYSFCLFLLFIVSMKCWFSWGIHTICFSIIALFLLITKNFYRIQWYMNKKNMMLVFLFYSSYIFISLKGSFQAIFTQIPSYLIPIIAIICISNDYKQKALSYITKWFALMMIPSLLLYIIISFYALPSLGRITPDVSAIYNYGLYENYIFYVNHIDFVGTVNRFNGPFVEPGHLGMMCAFLLFSNMYDFRNKYIIIILVSLLFSLSLAGYVLALLGYFLIKYYQGYLKFWRFIFNIIIIFFSIIIIQSYNNGNNIINEKILARLETDEEKGIAGNNRTTLAVSDYNYQMLSDPYLLLFGYNKDFLEKNSEDMRGNGIQLDLVRHGVLGVIWMIGMYLLICILSKEKKYAWLYMIFLLFCYIQRTYAHWYAWVICFNYAICTKDYIFQNYKNNNNVI